MMTTNKTNSGLAPKRWLRRDPEAERELLALLDGDVPRETCGTPAPRRDAQDSGARGVFPMELQNR